MTMILLASDLRQYTYCPRIVYYRYCLPAVRPVTYKMRAGQVAHQEEGGRERRRSLRAYGLERGTRAFDLSLEDAELGLRGRLDMAIYGEAEAIPVEYKNSPGRLGQHVIVQLAAYGLLLERQTQQPVTRGFVYSIPARRAREIALDAELRQQVLARVAEMRAMILSERMPKPPRSRRRCEICEFRRFCNDVV